MTKWWFASNKTPLFDAVMKASIEKAAHIAESESGKSGALAGAISILIMHAARCLLTFEDKPIKRITVDLDVLTFESLVFSAYSIRNAYNPMPAFEAEDYDERMDAYDESFSEVVNDAFKDACKIVLAVVERERGWQLLDLWNRRSVSYSQVRNKGSSTYEAFLSRVMTIDKAKEPLLTYHGKPFSGDLSMNAMLSASVMTFVSTMPESYAETIRRMVYHFGFE